MFNLRLKFELILLILLVILSIFAISYYKKYNSEYNKVLNKVTQINELTSDNTKYLNKIGSLVTVANEYALTNEELKNSNDSITIKMRDVMKASKLYKKQIRTLTNITSKVVITHHWDTIYLDTNNFPIYEFNDKWTSLIACVDSFNLINNNDYIIISAAKQVPRRGLLGWLGFKKTIDRNKIEVVSLNPNDKTKVRTIKLIK